MWEAIKRKDSHYIMPFLFVFGFGASFFPSMTGPFLADKGLTLTEYGIYGTIVGAGADDYGFAAAPPDLTASLRGVPDAFRFSSRDWFRTSCV